MRTETYPYSFRELFTLILRPERRFYWLMLVYALAVSALTLSVPLSVQVLISTVANAALVRQVMVLSLVLLALLLLSGLFTAIQFYLMELFERRFFARIVNEVTLRLVYARFRHLESINRDELVNRYFDIMSVQKSMPPLLTGALATVLQAIVGFTVTSFYHPVFIVFNLVVVLLAWLIYRMFDRGAAASALALSNTKYEAAKWLESLSRSNSFFKSERTIDYAIASSEAVRTAYVEAHRRHFRFTFAQVLGFLALYASGSAVLLGLGGWLVIIGQLTIGQLVAAELILAVIFAGLTRIGYYLELYYDLYAAMNKLTQLFVLPHEQVRSGNPVEVWEPTLRFEGVRYPLTGGDFHLDIDLPAGSHTLVAARSTAQVKAFTDLLLAFDQAPAGRVLLGGHAIEDFNVQRLRDEVHVIDSTLFPECSIADYLGIADPTLTRAGMFELLSTVALSTEMSKLEDDLDHLLTPYGYPLSPAGVIKVKIAYALAARPRVLVLTPLFDMLSHEARASVFDYLGQHREITVVCFTHRKDLACFDTYMLWNFDRQPGFASPAELEQTYNAVVDVAEGDGPAPIDGSLETA